MLTASEEAELLTLLEQERLEKVAPPFEAWRDHYRVKGAHGGRGAGAKSWSASSLLIQEAQYSPFGYPIVVVREIQKSIAESAYRLIWNQIERLRYPGWEQTEHRIGNTRNGCLFTFRGLKDLRATNSMKSLENVYRLWGEEASALSHASLSKTFPTIRREGSELWFTFNREEEYDPIYERLWMPRREDACLLELRPGREDNPWWTDELEKERQQDYLRDPDEAEHIWGGAPRLQGVNACIARTAIRAAMSRDLKPVGAKEAGVDVARYGDDSTEIYVRRGMKVIRHKTLKKADTVETADTVWDMVDRDPAVLIKVDDSGVGGGVTDNLRKHHNAKVVAVKNNSVASDQDKYPEAASEMWFEFPVDDADIPDDKALMRQLSGRRYGYDKAGRRKIEPKDKYKARAGESPDKADALLLCYYTGQNLNVGEDVRKAMAARRARGH